VPVRFGIGAPVSTRIRAKARALEAQTAQEAEVVRLAMAWWLVKHTGGVTMEAATALEAACTELACIRADSRPAFAREEKARKLRRK
jgi:hypothetical protein